MYAFDVKGMKVLDSYSHILLAKNLNLLIVHSDKLVCHKMLLALTMKGLKCLNYQTECTLLYMDVTGPIP